jgi:hypothetical protein
MLDRITEWFASERAAAFLGYVIGATVGVRAAEGMSVSEWIWAGIAILGVIQLRLFALDAPETETSAEEA